MMLDVLRNLIVPPAQAGRQRLTRKTKSASDNAQYGQSSFVDTLLNGRTNGFFVECGAADGETLSNSIFFELRRNWTGLLVEVNPKSYQHLRLKNRHAYSLHACLSPVNSPQMFDLRPYGLLGGLAGFMEAAHVKTITELKLVDVEEVSDIPTVCYPFYSVMLALSRTHVDYFSLDVEGAELQILETIPFDKLIIDVILVEYMVWGSEEATAAKLSKLREFFRKTKLYREVGILGKHDVAFRRMF